MSRPTRNGALVALAAALFVLAAQVVLQLLSTLLTATMFISSAPGYYLFGVAFPSYLFSMVLSWLPFVIGIFLILWLLAPITSVLRLGKVLARALFVVAGGAVVVFLAYLGAGLFSQVSSSEGMVFGWAAAVIGSVVTGLDSALGYAAYSALSSAIGLAPLTVLAVVLVWVWLRARPVQGTHPAPAADV